MGSYGEILQGFLLLWQYVGTRKIRITWFIYAVSLPVIGAILGALAYLIFLSGFLAVAGNIQPSDSTFFIMLLAGLAGFQFPVGSRFTQ